MHSHHSDGDWSPEELVNAARREGLRTVALTDHDTVDGVPAMQAAGSDAGLEVLSGIEISTWLDGDLHLLGYGFDPGDASLSVILARARKGRYDRAVRMTERLGELGMPLTIDQVLAEAGEGAIGRPHVASALVAAGHVGSHREAFVRWLGDGKPACVDKFRVEPAEAIRLLHDAGGVAVAAHPGAGETLDQLVAVGLDGVEVMHTLHRASVVQALGDYADAHGLVKTGGSDFHGPRGSGLVVGSVSIPDEWVAALRERIADRRERASRARGAAGTREGMRGADG
jgi:predicted metal-dependent phosphoesterase TrpH